MSLPFLDLDEEQDAQLIQFLNQQERGQECLIIHPGSHTIKFGLASQSQPFIVPNIIAYPTKMGQKIIDYLNPPEMEEKLQNAFDTQVERILPEIEHDLRKKKYFLIDAKSAKNIRNKQVSFKLFDESNSINEYEDTECEKTLELETDLCNTDVYHGFHGNDLNFLDRPYFSNPNTELRPCVVGRRVYCMHQDEEYLIRRPIKYGYFNVSQQYPLQQCCNDLQTILEESLWEYLKLPKKNFDQLNVILIIPDKFSKLHVRYMAQMLLGKMRFKGLFVHTESVLATYSMALPSACVVDIGSTKVNVCCVDEGIITPKSLKRKHFGGDDISQVLYRLINRGKALHYFPRFSLNLDYHVHQMMIDQIKEEYGICEMSQNEIVKTCHLFLKERYDEKKQLKYVKELIFNCSEALLLAPQSLFYSGILGVLRKCKNEIEEKVANECFTTMESFTDPEDIINDILQTMNAQQQQNTTQAQFKMPQPQPVFKNPGEDSPAGGNTPSLSVHQDNQSELDGDEELNEKVKSRYSKLLEPVDIDEIICKSICSHENPETRKRLAQQIILVGGTTKLNRFVDSLEDALINRFSMPQYDDTIERVEVVLINAQQQMQMQAQMLADPGLHQNLEQYKTDPRFMSWIGASIIPKLDSSKDLFIPREKFVVEFKPYKEHFIEMKNQQIQIALESMKNDQEEKKQGDDQVMKNESLEENKNGQEQLSAQQLEAIEKEVQKKIKKDRAMDGGVKHLKEKAPFNF